MKISFALFVLLAQSTNAPAIEVQLAGIGNSNHDDMLGSGAEGKGR